MLLCGSRMGFEVCKKILPTAQVFGNLGKEQKCLFPPKDCSLKHQLAFLRCISAPGTSGCLPWVSKRHVGFNFV